MKITNTQAVLDFFGDEQVIEDMLNNFNNGVEYSEDDSDYEESDTEEDTDEDSDDEEDSEVDEEEERHQFYRQEAQSMENENILADLPDLVTDEDSDTDVLEEETPIRLPPPPPLRRERASDYLLPLHPGRVLREEDYMTPVRNTEVRTPNAPERRVLGDLTNITIRPRRLRFN